MTETRPRRGKPSKYGLSSMSPGETKRFTGTTHTEQTNIRRSASNYNVRTNMYFTTRIIDGVVYVTRIR